MTRFDVSHVLVGKIAHAPVVAAVRAPPCCLWSASRIMSIPREYFETLEPTARQRYIKKLELLQLTENDDPYAAKNEHYFVDDMTLWPSVEYGRIFCYFVERPGVLQTRANAMEKFRPLRVFPSWAYADCEKHILIAARYHQCKPVYMFRLGEGCSQILFKIESAVRNGYTASTSSDCRWNNIFIKKVLC